MWLEFGCENCPFLIQPGLETNDRVEAVTTALWKGMWTILHENLTESRIVREKFPNGVLGTPTGTPAKGLYCLGFWRGLPNDVVDELKERNIDSSVRLWNRHSAEYLDQVVPDRVATDYSDDEYEDDEDEDEDTSLSGFIVDDENKAADEYPVRPEGPEMENVDEAMSRSASGSSDLDMGSDD